jgi:hypothetical protein
VPNVRLNEPSDAKNAVITVRRSSRLALARYAVKFAGVSVTSRPSASLTTGYGKSALLRIVKMFDGEPASGPASASSRSSAGDSVCGARRAMSSR